MKIQIMVHSRTGDDYKTISLVNEEGRRIDRFETKQDIEEGMYNRYEL